MYQVIRYLEKPILCSVSTVMKDVKKLERFFYVLALNTITNKLHALWLYPQ